VSLSGARFRGKSVNSNRRKDAAAHSGARPAIRKRGLHLPVALASNGAREVCAVPELSDQKFILEYKRNRALSTISHETRVGEVDGIHFDLRHEDINPKEWTMDVLGGDYGWGEPRRRPTLPFIWFPWYGEFDLSKVKNAVLEEFRAANERPRRPLPRELFDNISDTDYQAYLGSDTWKGEKLPKSWIRDEIKDRTPDAIVQSGDYISVDRVEMKLINYEFAFLADRAEVLLFLMIYYANGRKELIKSPIILQGATKLTYKYGNKPLYAIIERVKRGVWRKKKITRSAVHEFDDKLDINANAYAALSRAAKICDLYFPTVSKLYNSDSNVRSRLGFKFLHALDDACMLGYAWANAEADHKMRPSALSALKSKAGAAVGGSTSGKKRLQKRIDGWEPIAKEMANEIRDAQPGFSQDDVATDIALKWKSRDYDAPGHTTLKGLISRMEKAGELPRRRRKKSAKGL
jgi:hypothetical protein